MGKGLYAVCNTYVCVNIDQEVCWEDGSAWVLWNKRCIVKEVQVGFRAANCKYTQGMNTDKAKGTR